MAILLDSVGGVSSNSSTVGWIRTPYGIRISEDPSKDFKTLQQHLQHALIVDSESADDTKKSVASWMDALTNPNLQTAYGTTPQSSLINGQTYYSAPNYTDTRVGGNDVINPYWQFNRDDDITPPMFEIGGHKNRRGMGRVYAETYEANQSVLWLQMGVPEFANLVELFSVSGNSDAATAMNQGSLLSLGTKIITLVVKGALWLITFPITAPFFAIKWLSTMGSNEITKFYRFRPAMPLYFDMVNTMMSYLAVNLGIYPAYLMKRANSTVNYETLSAEAPMETKVDSELKSDDVEKRLNESAMPELLKSGPDIYVILNRRRANYQASCQKVTARQILMETATAPGNTTIPPNGTPNLEVHQMTNFDGSKHSQTYASGVTAKGKAENEKSVPSRYFSYLKSSILGAFDFVGFKCEKGVNTSDTVSNSTASSPLFDNLNNMSRNSRVTFNDRSFVGRTIIKAASGTSADGIIKSELARLGLNIADSIGMGSAGAIIANGNGFFDVPEMWSGSSFDRSISFNIQLRARYGDMVSIYQSIYIPLMMLLTAACPRAIGDNMYTSPFLVKAYCKGKFSITCGMITSMTITRGKDAYGWSDAELPTAIDVNLTIKDLSPAMFLAMQDIGLFDTFTRNESIMDYLDTLSALGIYERMYEFPRMMRKLTAAVLVKKNTIFSPEWWAMRTAKSRAGLAFSALSPWRPVHEQEDYAAISR